MHGKAPQKKGCRNELPCHESDADSAVRLLAAVQAATESGGVAVVRVVDPVDDHTVREYPETEQHHHEITTWFPVFVPTYSGQQREERGGRAG